MTVVLHLRRNGCLLLVMAALTGAPAWAAVERIVVTERVPFAAGMTFGEFGAYEKIRGVAYFALEPDAAANSRIVDLKLAPRDARGKVTFSSEFLVLRPVHAAASTLLYDVNNRGSIAILGQVNGRSPLHNDPTTIADTGDGFLMRHGFTLLFSAWTWDVAPQGPGERPLVFVPPIARGPHGPLTGVVYNEFTVNSPSDTAVYAGFRGLTYAPATADDPDARLTFRARPDEPRQLIERARWQLLPPERAGGPGRITLDGGFKPGRLYEVTYKARDPYVTGAGLAGIRDLLAYFRDHPIEDAAPPRSVLIFGISQSARVIGRMLHDGLDVAENGKLAFDGAYLEVPGAGGSAGFNSRFAQPTRHPSMLEEHDYPADAFPFTTVPARDALTGQTASYLDRARDAQGRLPKIMMANASTEYWNRDASLLTTSPDGMQDVAPAAGVRVYGFMGAQHYVGRSRTREPYTNCVSTTDHYLPMRALLLALRAWIDDDVAPPPSAYPNLADGTLIDVDTYRARFSAGFGLVPPAHNLREPRLLFGAGFERDGVARIAPPLHGADFETRVPAADADGNDRGGVRLIELVVPLGTHTGWNLRRADTGFPWATARFDGSFVPFARTPGERTAAADQRPSIAERYAGRDDFVARVKQAAQAQHAAGFLLDEDIARAVDENVGLYDRIMTRDSAAVGCDYLYAE